MITDKNGEFNFRVDSIPNFPKEGNFIITILPSKAFASSKNISKEKQQIKVKFKKPVDGKFDFILLWEQSKAENRGSFAVSGKNST